MANIEGAVFSGFLVPKEKPIGNVGFAQEVVKRKGTSMVIYGAGNTNAGSNDCQLLNSFVGAVITGEATTGANSFYVISSTTTTNDTITITSSNDVIYTIVLFGWANKS